MVWRHAVKCDDLWFQSIPGACRRVAKRNVEAAFVQPITSRRRVICRKCFICRAVLRRAQCKPTPIK